MATPCYCCSQKTGERSTVAASSSEDTDHMDLDAALFELGMLSSVTESRHQYVGEQWKKYEDLMGRRSSARFGSTSHPGACVLQMNSKYVTRFSFAPELSSASLQQENDKGESESNDARLNLCSNPSSCLSFLESTSSVHTRKQAKMKSTKYRYYYSPYRNHYLPWLHRQEDAARKLVHQPISSSSSEGGSTPSSGTPRQDSGNKSNPGSPIKNEKGVSSTGCSIVRSRSLDDLDINKIENSFHDSCSNLAGRAEIETVSQRISNLHVS